MELKYPGPPGALLPFDYTLELRLIVATNTISSPIAKEVNATSDSITNFNTDALSTTVDITDKIYYANAPIDSMLRDTSGSLGNFLSRPIILRSGLWGSSSAAGARLVGLDLPYESLSMAQVLPKVVGFKSFRGTAVIRLVVNAQKFQQGRLIMTFIPQAQVVGTYPYNRLLTRVTITQLPRVELDASCDSEAIMRIPWTSPLTHYNMMTKEGPLGAVFMHVYSPLVGIAGSADTAEYNIYVHWEDVELLNPTAPSTFFPQSGIIRRSRKTPGDAELASANKKPISSALTSVSLASGALAKIPLLSSVCAPVSWFTELLAGAASAFGYSQPRDMSPSNVVVKRVASGLTNSDIGSVAVTHGLSVKNQVATVNLSGRPQDETSFSYIFQQSAYIAEFAWPVATTIENILYAVDCYPVNNNNSTVITGTVRAEHPISCIGRKFKYYRGSIGFTFKFVKTTFHSGRLLVAFYPGISSSPAMALAAYAFKETIDVRECNEISFTFPYVSDTPYLPVGTSYGRVVVYVLNPLRGPASVPTSVQVLVEMFGGPDFEVAHPVPSPDYCDPCILLAGQTAFVAQSGSMEPCLINDTNHVLTDLPLSVDSVMNSQFCIGERMTSVNQLIKRPSYWAAGFTDATNIAYLTLHLHSICGFAETAVPGTYYAPNYYGDIVSFFSMFYAYLRGSKRLLMYHTHYYGDNSIESLIKGRSITYPAVVGTATIFGHKNGSRVLSFSTSEGAHNVEVPYYSQTDKTLVRCNAAAEAGAPVIPIDIYDTTPDLLINLSSPVAPTRLNTHLFLSAGEDYQLGYYLGAPLIRFAA